jgi:hypothetical protein
VGVSVVAGLLQLMHYTQMFAIPKFVEWAAAIVAAVWTSDPMIILLFSGKATPGVGWFLGLFCAAAPLACLIVPTCNVKPDDDRSDPQS